MTGQQLIDRWVAFIRRYVVLSEQQALVVALWAMNTWVYDHFPSVPFLEIVATTKRSGKTTLLNALRMVCRGSEQFAIVRILTILRMIEAYEGKVTILVDEAEQFSKPSLGEVRSGVATGYQQGAQHAISVGKSFQRFRTFAPWAFAQIGNVHDVLRDRCIEIELQRGKPERVLSEWDITAKAEGQELIAELVQFAASKVKDGKLHIPVVAADWLSGRERQLWTPLVSIATWIGVHADTMKALQVASVDLGLLKTLPPKVWHSAQDEQDAEERDMAERALADLITVAGDDAFIPSDVAVDRMRSIPIAPWRAWRGTGLNVILLAALLARYGVQPVQGRLPGKRKDANPKRGYKLADLVAASKSK
jgi:hypothetical protein